jgi:hypothetical protein
MKILKFLMTFFLLLSLPSIYSQEQKILIFDPNNVSASFQSKLSQISNDSVFVADTLDDAIFNYDGLFLFINPPYALSQAEGNRLIQYTSDNKPAYLFTGIFPEGLDTIAFWNHIGIEEMQGLLISVPIDTVFGVTGEFTEGIVIDTNFMSGLIPVIIGNVDSILIGDAGFWEVNTTFISGFDSLNVIIDLYNLIDDYWFLEKVLQKFGLISLPQNVQIQFFPPLDTALVNGGCCTPQIVAKDLTSTSSRDSISIEPGPNTLFYYFDSTGTQIFLDNYYFIVIDSLDEFEYELWYHPTAIPATTGSNQFIIPFDSAFYTDNNEYDIQLIVKKNGLIIDSLYQPFHADFGLSVDDNEFAVKDFYLSQNYPNPFNPSTKIKYQIPDQVRNDSRLVTLKVYDILGNEVATLVNEEKQPGNYEVVFDATGLTSGIYFYQLREHNFVETKKMLILK